jgi:hypothetical protein
MKTKGNKMDIIAGANFGKIGFKFVASGAAKYYYLRQELDKYKGINPFMGLSGAQIETLFIDSLGRLRGALAYWESGSRLIGGDIIKPLLLNLLYMIEAGAASGAILPDWDGSELPGSLKHWAVNHSPVAVRPVAGRLFSMVPEIDGATGTGAEIERYMMAHSGATKEDIHKYLSKGGFITGGLKDFKVGKYLSSEKYRCEGRKYYLR